MSDERQDHNVVLRIGGQLVEHWSDYDITLDMMQPADPFRLTLPRGTKRAFELCKPDAEAQVFIDDVLVMTVFLGDRKYKSARAGTGLVVTGRDRGGRVLDESMPLLSFVGLTLEQLAQKACGIGEISPPWFDQVIFSNAKNRALLTGGGAYQAAVAREPPISTSPRATKKVTPGESRWHVLSKFLEEAGYLAWSSADGRSLIIGQPNYEQQPEYKFFLPKPGSDRMREGNIIDVELQDSVEERYSEIIAVGAGRGNKEQYSDAVTSRRASVTNGPGLHGVGKDFQRRKVLLVADNDVRTPALALERAKREMAYRDATARRLTLRVKGHAQLHGGAHRPAMYIPDRMAIVELEELGLKDLFLATSVNFQHNRADGETTTIQLVPKGTVLKT